MKNLYLLVLMVCAAVCANAQTAVQFRLTDPTYGVSMTTNIEVIMQQQGVNNSGQVTLLPLTLYGWTDTNGICTFSNVGVGIIPPAYYHVTVPANSNPQGNGPPQTYQWDIIVLSTNLGTVQASTLFAGNGPTYPYGSGWAWSATASDARYSMSTNSYTNFVQIGQLNLASNYLATSIQSSTNLMTGIVYSNPAAYATPTQVTNIANALAQTNFPASFTITTVTNIAYQQATNQAILLTNYTQSASNYVYTNLSSTITTASNGLQAAIISTNTLLTANLVTTSNALQFLKQPASGILTNLALTGAYTNIIAPGLNVYLTTNGGGNTMSINASNQTFLTNGLLTGYAPTNTLNGWYDTNGAGSYFAQAATNGMLATVTNIAKGFIGQGANTNNYIPGSNVAFTTNGSGSIIFINATNQTFLTNGLAVWSSVVPSSYLTTNVIPSLTNSFITGLVATNSFDTNGAYVYAMNYASAVGGAATNGFLALSNNLTAQYTATNRNTLAVMTNYVGQITANMITNRNASAVTISNPANLFIGQVVDSTGITLTNNSSQNIAFNNQVSFNAALTLPNLSVSRPVATDSRGNLSTPNNLSAAGNITAVSFIDSTGTLPPASTIATTNNVVAATNGLATALTVLGSLAMGAQTNLYLGTNWIGVSGCGSVGAQGTYGASAVGTWTNFSNSKFSIVYSGGSYYLNSNSATLYFSPTVNGLWFQGPYGALPSPQVCYGSELRITGTPLIGYVVATNLASQWNSAISLALAGVSSPALSGAVQGLTNNVLFSQSGSNTISYLASMVATGPTNGLSTNSFYALISGVTNAIPMNGVITNNNITTAFSIAGTNALVNIISIYAANTNLSNLSSNGLVVITNIANSVELIVGGFANTNFGNISQTATNVISSIASGAATGIAQANGQGTNTTLTTAKSITVTNLTLAGPFNVFTNSVTNVSKVYFADGLVMSGIDSSGSLSPPYGGLFGSNYSIYITDATSLTNHPYREFYNTVIGGQGNYAVPFTSYATIIGGAMNSFGPTNDLSYNGQFGAIVGGSANFIGAVNGAANNGGGDGSFIGGGYANFAQGTMDTLFGRYCIVTNRNCFVWSDGDLTLGATTALPDMAAFYAQNGVAINIDNANGNQLEVNGTIDASIGMSSASNSVGLLRATDASITNLTVSQFFYNGLPYSLSNSISPSYTSFYVTNAAAGVASNFDGIYYSQAAVLNSFNVFTNASATNRYLYVSSLWNYLSANNSPLLAAAYSRNSSPLGSYTAQGSWNSQKPVVSIYSSTTPYFLVGGVGPYDGSLVTNLNAVYPNQLIVSPQGNDATAVRGTSKAWAHLSAASSNMLSGDICYIQSGTYTDYQACANSLAKNVSIIGIGQPTIRFGITNGIVSPYSIYLKPSDNSYFSGFNISVWDTNQFVAVIGAGSNTLSATNYTFFNIKAPTCDSDGVYFNGPSNNWGYFRQCVINGCWDTFASVVPCNPNNWWDFDGCDVQANYTNSVIPANNKGFNLTVGALYVRNCKIGASRITSSTAGIHIAGGYLFAQNNVINVPKSATCWDVNTIGGVTQIGNGNVRLDGNLLAMPQSQGGAVTYISPVMGLLSMGTDTNGYYGFWNAVYLGDQGGFADGGSITFTNQLNANDQPGTPVSITFGSDNSPLPGVSVINGGYSLNNTPGLSAIVAIQTNAVGPHGIKLQIGGGIITNTVNY